MNNVKDIVLVVDYHDKNLEFRRFDADAVFQLVDVLQDG